MAHARTARLLTLGLGILLLCPVAYASRTVGYRGAHDQFGHHRHQTDYRMHAHDGGRPYVHAGHYPIIGHNRHAFRSLVLVDVRHDDAVTTFDPGHQFDLVRAKPRVPGAAAGPAGTAGIRLPDAHRDYVHVETDTIVVVHRRDEALPATPQGPDSGHAAYAKRRVDGAHVMIVRRGTDTQVAQAENR